MPYPKPLIEVLKETARPVFLFGSTPPKEGTSEEKAKESCAKFAARSAVLATDGFVVYDIQDEGARTNLERPFPFRKTMDPALYASFFPTFSGKETIVYKCVTEETVFDFDQWFDKACNLYNHSCFNLVGAVSSTEKRNISLVTAAERAKRHSSAAFGCVCIPERHTAKGNEHMNMVNKTKMGAQWFITQGIFDADPAIKLLNDYGDLCRQSSLVPQKVILTFAPCGRSKTMKFIHWLGMQVPEAVESRIFMSENPVRESIDLLKELLVRILKYTSGSGVPIGLNVESLSIFKEEIDGAHELFQILQATLLNSAGSPWAIRWFYIPLKNSNNSSRDNLVSVGGDSSGPETLKLTAGVMVQQNGAVVDISSGQIASANKGPLKNFNEASSIEGSRNLLTSVAVVSCALGIALGFLMSRKSFL